jgi:hypothetical protein
LLLLLLLCLLLLRTGDAALGIVRDPDHERHGLIQANACSSLLSPLLLLLLLLLLRTGDAALGIGWDHDGKDTGSYNLTQEWAGVQFEQPRT